MLTVLFGMALLGSPVKSGEMSVSVRQMSSITIRHSAEHLSSEEARAELRLLLQKTFDLDAKFVAAPGTSVLLVTTAEGKPAPAAVIDYVWWFDSLEDDCGA